MNPRKPPRRPFKGNPLPKNVLEFNSRYDINGQDKALAEITRSWGMDPDQLAIMADGTLKITDNNEADGVQFELNSEWGKGAGGYVPSPRKKLSNPMPGLDAHTAQE